MKPLAEFLTRFALGLAGLFGAFVAMLESHDQPLLATACPFGVLLFFAALTAFREPT